MRAYRIGEILEKQEDRRGGRNRRKRNVNSERERGERDSILDGADEGIPGLFDASERTIFTSRFFFLPRVWDVRKRADELTPLC